MRRFIFSIILISASFSQDLQVRVVGRMQMDVPVLGPFKMIFDQTVAPGFLKAEEKIEAKRFYARWLMNGETGEIMIAGTEKILKYDKDDVEYWLQSPEDYFKKPDTSTENTNSMSFSISSDEDDDTPPQFTRTGGKEIEFLHGFRTKKWITTISFSDKRMVFEEWFVEKLPLMILSDSLETAIKTKFNPDGELVTVEHTEFSSNVFIVGMDSLTTLEPIEGHAVKINFLVYEDSDKPKFTVGYEILELYAEPVDTGYFVISEEYQRIKND
ncbi:MAG: hypothetical protein HOM78_09840 [Candidatus Marinimicrobia bacterium]|nr:hypothetical protein [Candidatus Neomarinimicrobiota bacterium]